MTNSGRSKSARRSKRSASQMIIAALLALAVIASLFLIFSNSVQLLRVGLVVALWAATLGAIAMTKYRRESALDKAKVADLQTVYELQLEREISARREYELSVEGRVRREVTADAEELAGLRAELVALRRNLEALFEGGLLPEQTALKTDSTRVPELGGSSYGAYQPAPSGLYVPGAGQSGPSQPAPNVGGLASPNDDPVTAETTVVFAETSWRDSSFVAPRVIPTQKSQETQKPQSGNQAPSSPVSSSPSRTVKDVPVKKDPEPVAPVEPEVKAPAQAPKIEDAVIEDAVVEEVHEVVAEGEPEPAAEPDAEPRRRRRAAPEDAASGAHSNGLTVAEIMANLSSNNPSEGSGRRRRRED
ncbi:MULTISPECIES: DUF6779 domain-containing protein [unclassified Rhodococcus (in: high G+C Gram-positive bacteria)]|uniref:DUF6779 domain-containing protein n=1 Tax=unclassified Rhodococcus (in: high G+C Gram-positive bacteria) TaxID=192944 RepID=UPI0024B6C398|nr:MULTISPECIES: DUF6779 domain-containing protein [unclassified Rhodococcus (in: high G+C Gram-positive bacteria)]MDI9956825.1 hypothetical protein [Rhodococcus sp. IEGM 1237]MDI9962635.1 hypothetical protein [Rhodococcus sp. IEGM 1251]MDV8125823.1 DUF6779 domain-containing protein [Rhodococcus sp. IEGM 1304]